MRSDDVKKLRDFIVEKVIPQFDEGKKSVYIPIEEFPDGTPRMEILVESISELYGLGVEVDDSWFCDLIGYKFYIRDDDRDFMLFPEDARRKRIRRISTYSEFMRELMKRILLGGDVFVCTCRVAEYSYFMDGVLTGLYHLEVLWEDDEFVSMNVFLSE